MIEDLRSLLSISSVKPLSEDLLHTKADAINKFTQDPNQIQKYIGLVKFIYSIEDENDSTIELRQCISDVDPSDSKQKKSLELKFISLVALKHLVENNPLRVGAPISLALVNCFGFGLRGKPRGYEIEDFSENLLTRSFLKRKNPETGKANTTISTSISIPEKIVAGITMPDLVENLKKIISDINITINEYAKKTNEKLAEIEVKEALLSEETSILWWVFSNISIKTKKPWKQIAPNEAYLLIGEELAGHIKIAPGPSSYKEIIKKMLTDNFKDASEEISLKTIISKAPKEWRQDVIKSADTLIDKVTPIHYLIMRSLEAKINLEAAFSEGKIISSRRLSPHMLASQFYRECVYIKCIQDLGG